MGGMLQKLSAQVKSIGAGEIRCANPLRKTPFNLKQNQPEAPRLHPIPVHSDCAFGPVRKTIMLEITGAQPKADLCQEWWRRFCGRVVVVGSSAGQMGRTAACGLRGGAVGLDSQGAQAQSRSGSAAAVEANSDMWLDRGVVADEQPRKRHKSIVCEARLQKVRTDTFSALGTLAVILLPVCCRADITAFYLTSEPGSWVGQGQTVLITSHDPFSIRTHWQPSPYFVSFQIDNFASVPPSDPSRSPSNS
jgi:hypothetical protein